MKYGSGVGYPEYTTPEYVAWNSMKSRCYSPRYANYEKYGGMGVGVSERWLKYENFLADMGRKPTPEHTLDRFPNREGNYEPGNVRWASKLEQTQNRDCTVLYTLGDVTKTAGEWARALGIARQSLYQRVREWPLDKALTLPRKTSAVRQVGQ
jgi:hypothetical protein